MNDENKSKDQLLYELKQLKQELAELTKAEGNYKKVKSDLIESEEKYRILFESSRDAIMVISPPDWYFVDGNSAAIEMFGAKDKEEFTSKKPDELSPEYQPDGQLSSIKARMMIEDAMKAGSKIFEWVHKKINGEEFPATVQLTRVELRNEKFVEATVRDITERKHNEEELTKHRNRLQDMVIEQTEELRKSELQFRTLSDNLPGVVYMCKNDKEFTVIYVNNNVKKLTGYARKEFLDGKIDFDRLYHPDDRKKVYEDIDKALAERRAFHLNCRIKHKSGDWRYIEEYGIGVYQDNKLQYLEGFIHDVTSRVESEEKLRHILENSTNLFYSHKLDDVLTYVSPQVREIMGYEPEEAKVKWTELVSDNPLNEIGYKLTEQAIKTCKSQSPYELEVIHKSGRKVWVEVHEAPIVENGKTISMVGAITDITERKRFEQKRQVLYNISNAATNNYNLNELIRFIHTELGKLIDTTNFFIALYDDDSDSIILQYIKDKSESISTFPAGKTITSYVIKTQKPFLATADIINDLVDRGEIELIREFSKVWLGVPLKLEEKVIGVLVVQSYDDEQAYNQSDLELLEFVSDQISVSIGRKQAEEDIKVALEKARESDRLKSVFLGTMSHEFRTPLNTIIGFSDIIDENTPSEQVLDFVKTINNSGKQILSLVEDILGISLIETGGIKIIKEEFVLDAFMNDIQSVLELEQLQSGKNHLEILYEISEENKGIMAYTDARKLHQILINLLKNALKFTEEGFIKYGYTTVVIDGKSLLKFFIKDSGIGIAKDKMDYIFDIFRQGDDTYTRRYDGVGIGLSVSKKLTELLGGEMWLESEVGKGSCFYFTISYIPQIS